MTNEAILSAERVKEISEAPISDSFPEVGRICASHEALRAERDKIDSLLTTKCDEAIERERQYSKDWFDLRGENNALRAECERMKAWHDARLLEWSKLDDANEEEIGRLRKALEDLRAHFNKRSNQVHDGPCMDFGHNMTLLIDAALNPPKQEPKGD